MIKFAHFMEETFLMVFTFNGLASSFAFLYFILQMHQSRYKSHFWAIAWRKCSTGSVQRDDTNNLQVK